MSFRPAPTSSLNEKSREAKKSSLPSVLNLDYGTTRGSVYSIVPTDARGASRLHVDANIRNRNTGFCYEPHAECASFEKNRILARDAAFHQSRGRMNIKKMIGQADWAQLYADDLFHSLIDAPTSRTLLLLIVAYLSIVFIYAVLYLFFGEVYDCNLEIYNFVEAFFFSLETMATIGYGTSDIFFGDCIGLGLILTTQICVKILTDAVVIGVIYCRVSRPNKRASTVVFSKNAIIKRIRGKLFFQFRVCELRKHQLVEAHIRCYTIRHERDVQNGVVTPFRSLSMRLNHPNDELGGIYVVHFVVVVVIIIPGMLLMCLPQEIVHEIDAWSPIMPPPSWASAIGVYHWDPPVLAHAKKNLNGINESDVGFDMHSYDTDLWFNYPDITRRSASCSPDSVFRAPHPHLSRGNEPKELNKKKDGDVHKFKHALHDKNVKKRDSSIVPALSPPPHPHAKKKQKEKEPTAQEKKRNPTKVNNLQNDEKIDEFNSNHFGSYIESYSLSGDEINYKKFFNEEHWEIEEREMIRKFMIDRNVEVVVLVEGQDALTGGAVQARHSYKIEDIVWNASFVPCISEDNDEGHAAIIDYTLFHETRSDYPTPNHSFATPLSNVDDDNDDENV